MDPLKLALAAFSLLAASPAQADALDRWQPLIAEASVRFGIPSEWIERVIHAESRGRTALQGRPTTSTAGAMGLMQLMPRTWADMRTRLGLGADPHDPRDNILAGTFYLRLMYDRFGYPGLFGAYNAGPGRYGAYLAGMSRLPGETVAYMAATTVGSTIPAAARTASGPRLNAIFFTVAPPAAPMAPQPDRTAIFVVLRDAARP